MKLIVAVAIVAGVAATGRADPMPASGVKQVSADTDKLKCKRYVETGSLARVREECHSRARWEQLAVEGRENAFYLAGNTIEGGSHLSDDPKPK